LIPPNDRLNPSAQHLEPGAQPRTHRDARGGKGEVACWPWWKKPFSALFIADATRFNAGVATLHIRPVQSLDAPELAL